MLASSSHAREDEAIRPSDPAQASPARQFPVIAELAADLVHPPPTAARRNRSSAPAGAAASSGDPSLAAQKHPVPARPAGPPGHGSAVHNGGCCTRLRLALVTDRD